MLNETFSVIFKHRGVGWGRYWNVNGDVALVHFGQPNIRPEAEMWLPTCTRAKFVCSGDYFHFLPRRIFSLSMRLLGFQVQLLTYRGAGGGKMALNRHPKKDHSMNNSLTKNNPFCWPRIKWKNCTVFENHRKSLIQHCERSELCLHFKWTKVS